MTMISSIDECLVWSPRRKIWEICHAGHHEGKLAWFDRQGFIFFMPENEGDAIVAALPEASNPLVVTYHRNGTKSKTSVYLEKAAEVLRKNDCTSKLKTMTLKSLAHEIFNSLPEAQKATTSEHHVGQSITTGVTRQKVQRIKRFNNAPFGYYLNA